MSTKQKIFLFDMDGTLTPVRGMVEPKIIQALCRLSRVCKIGVVTGSDYDYITQQMSAVINSSEIVPGQLELLPCNGTKRYTADSSRQFNLTSEVNMIDEIGEDEYALLLRRCITYQLVIMSKYSQLPYRGTFLQHRGSLLNWCPIGRDAGAEERDAWVETDNNNDIREYYAESMEHICAINDINVTVALGGSTSLDIYPTGWDKTFALSYYPDYDVYFAGDKCMKGGNDWHLYEALSSMNRSFMVDSTDDTVAVIQNFMVNSPDDTVAAVQKFLNKK